MVEDNPEEALEDRAMSLAWPEHPLGQPILGRPEVIERAAAAALRDYMREHISGGRVWVVAAGDVEHDALVAACGELAALPAGEVAAQTPPQFIPGVHPVTLDSEQSQLLWIMPIPPAGADNHYAHLVANHVLGGGVSSRLFQELRERRGLVYGIHSRLEYYSDGGTWSIHTACDPDHIDACRDIVARSVEQLLQEGLDAAGTGNRPPSPQRGTGHRRRSPGQHHGAPGAGGHLSAASPRFLGTHGPLEPGHVRGGLLGAGRRLVTPPACLHRRREPGTG